MSDASKQDFHHSETSTISKSSSSSSLGSMPKYAVASEPTECSPLLNNDDLRRGSVVDLHSRREILSNPKIVLSIIMLCVVLSSLGDQIIESPQTRIIESVICYRYYEAHDPSKIVIPRDIVGPGALDGVAESWCKVNPVQDELAMLRGYQQLFDGIPSLLLAVPFGWAADKYGRKPFILLGLASFVLRASWIQLVTWFWQSFDIKMTWWSTLHGCLAGSNPVVGALVFTILADVVPEAGRASVFLRVGAANLVANVVCPPIAAWGMRYNAWIPTLSGTLLQIMALLLYTLVPETKDFRLGDPPSHPPSPPPEPMPEREPSVCDSLGSEITGLAGQWRVRFRNATSFLTNDWRVPILITIFIGHILIGSATTLLLQYCSKRYDLTFSNATLLLTIYNGVRVFLLLVLLPYLSTALMHFLHLSGQTKDLYLSRASLFLMAAGFTLIGLAPNIPAVAIGMIVASLGAGAFLVLRSYLTSLVPAHHVARVYSIISIIDSIGAMLGGAGLAKLFGLGIGMGQAWEGLPFLFLGLITAVFAAVTFGVRSKGSEGDFEALLAGRDRDEEER